LGESSLCERLFDSLVQLKTFEESKLKDEFGKNYSVIKNRLRENILRAMYFYHHQKTENNRFYTLISEVEFLHQKNSISLAKKKLNAALKLALKIEDNIKLLIVDQWEKKLQIQNEDSFFRVQAALNNVKLSTEVAIIKNKIFQKDFKGFEKYRNRLVELGRRDKVQGKKTALEFEIQHALSALHFFKGDHRKALKHGQLALKQLPEDDTENRIQIFGNLIFLATRLKEFDKAKTFLFILKMLQKEKTEIPSQRARLFENISSLELFIKIGEKRISEAAESIPQIAKRLKNYNGEISPEKRASFYMNFTQIYFLKCEFKQALRWSNELLNHPELTREKDILFHASILNLMIHFELSNYAYIKRIIPSLKRQWVREKKYNSFERELLHRFSTNLNNVDFQDWLNTLLESSKKQKFEEQVVRTETFGFEKWLESKVKNVEMIYLI